MSSVVAFLGIGLMGKPMVEKLLHAGYHCRLWNRTRAKADAFADWTGPGQVVICETPAEAVTGCDTVITMLENGQVVDSIFRQSSFLSALPAGCQVIDMSSIPPVLAREHANLIEAKQARYLDAPVSGGTVGAAQGMLSVMVGGDPSDFDQARPLFEIFGKPTYIGPHGSGQLAKLANQTIVGITIGAVAEALLLAAKGGADPVAVREALLGGFASSRILELHGARMLDRDFEPGATARVQHKDLRMILDAAQEESLTLPLTQEVFTQYEALLQSGQEGVDHSGLLLQLETLNNTELTRRS